MIVIRHALDGRGDEISLATGLSCPEDTLAQQSSKEEADINTLVKRFGITGQLPVGVKAPMYQDFDGIFDYQTAMNAVIAADRAFMAMPADVRYRFGNDPQRFVEFCSKEENREEAIKLGLVIPEKKEETPAGVKPQE